MPRSFDFSVESSLSAGQIHSAFSTEEYWLARLAEFGGTGRLDSLTIGSDGSANVAIVQAVSHDGLPGLFAKLYPGDLDVVQNERWRLVGDNTVRGEVKTTARGALGSGLGTVLMTPAQNGTHLNCSAKVQIKVPFVGGAIESFMGRQMIEETPVMLRFTAKWLTENA